MKSINIINNPVVLVTVFCLILISGEHWGGFYLLYILLGLPHGALHSIAAVAGITILLFSNYKYKRTFTHVAEPLINITGVVLLGLSLFFFFYTDSNQYNHSTFRETVPLIILALFTLLAVSFFIINLMKLSSGMFSKST